MHTHQHTYTHPHRGMTLFCLYLCTPLRLALLIFLPFFRLFWPCALCRLQSTDQPTNQKVNSNNNREISVERSRTTNYINMSTTTTYQFSLWPVTEHTHTLNCEQRGKDYKHMHLHTLHTERT